MWPDKPFCHTSDRKHGPWGAIGSTHSRKPRFCAQGDTTCADVQRRFQDGVAAALEHSHTCICEWGRCDRMRLQAGCRDCKYWVFWPMAHPDYSLADSGSRQQRRRRGSRELPASAGSMPVPMHGAWTRVLTSRLQGVPRWEMGIWEPNPTPMFFDAAGGDGARSHTVQYGSGWC